MITVDARGKSCPQPLIMTKNVLLENPGTEISILIDNETSCQNVQNYLNANKITFLTEKTEKEFCLKIGATTSKQWSEPEEHCPATPAKKHCIYINRSIMGGDSDELGALLMKGFINTIKNISPLPGAIIFVNSGIYLSTEGSPVIEPLSDLESMGISILSCGTCLDYYEKKEQLRVGKISNMYDILEILSKSSHVVTP